MLRKTIQFGSRFIDYKMAIAGAFVMGGVVFCVNYFATDNLLGSSTAGLKQGSYTFLLGGILMKGCENIAKSIENRFVAVFFAMLIPSCLTLLLTFGMHNLKGTPKPLESTLPTLVIIPATAIWGYMKHKEKNKETN